MLYIAYLNKDDDIQRSACILQARAHFALPVRCRYYIGFKSTGFVCALFILEEGDSMGCADHIRVDSDILSDDIIIKISGGYHEYKYSKTKRPL